MLFPMLGSDPITRRAFSGEDPTAYPKAVDVMHRARDHGVDPYTLFVVANEHDDKGVFDRRLEFSDAASARKAEFAIFTPHPDYFRAGSPSRRGAVFHSDGSKYNDDNVVFRPARMSPERMLEHYLHRWREFYCVRPALDGDDYAG